MGSEMCIRDRLRCDARVNLRDDSLADCRRREGRTSQPRVREKREGEKRNRERDAEKGDRGRQQMSTGATRPHPRTLARRQPWPRAPPQPSPPSRARAARHVWSRTPWQLREGGGRRRSARGEGARRHARFLLSPRPSTNKTRGAPRGERGEPLARGQADWTRVSRSPRQFAAPPTEGSRRYRRG